ncbi:Aspyridones efflux protein [Lachnellula subtilissima]|uniref:Aspyridones efflux protein n=1 Tax=Lachnellula subtilissima TaxID=602034 RepID=A0A8H8RVA0_9HELO|nr:Aspyridones efflux protein [Lachnellula subtilissima]
MFSNPFSRGIRPSNDNEDEKEIEDDTAWMQVLMGHLLVFNTWGYINSFSIFQEYYTTQLQQSPSAISWVGSLQIFLTLFLGTFAGIALDSGLYRVVLFVGPLLQLIGIFLTSISTKYWHLVVVQGIVQGLGDGLIFGPTITNISTYFSKKRSLAMAIVASGTATGGVVFPIIAQQLLPRIGFPWTIRVLGFVVLFNASIAQIFSRERTMRKVSGPLFDLKAFRDVRYSMFGAGIFMIFCSLYVGFFYISTFARDAVHLSVSTSRTILIIINAVGVPGRIIPAILADGYIGPVKTLLPFVFMGSIVLYSWITVRSLGGLIPFIILYGIAGAAIQGLFPSALASLTDDPKQKGVRMGMVLSIAGLGSLAGPPIAGALITTDGGGFLYAQIFGGTMMMGGAIILSLDQLIAWKMSRHSAATDIGNHSIPSIREVC